MSGNIDRLNTALAGRYRIERELGAGGMATVYLAEDLKHDRKIAIKVLKPELAAVLGAERFVVEIKTTAAMSHPHILPLFDSGTADGFLFYVMPYIEGETIREKLTRETQFGVDEAVRIAREVADALDYAHRHGVIHRDIKPENILLHDGRAMVMDFGIALAVSAAAGGRMTETCLSLGTPHYMSPEQATAEKEITARSDIYSLASVLYEMLAGEPPHGGGSAQAIIMKIIAEPAQEVTKLRKSVPPNVAASLAKALEKVPADRFESAKAFADALGNATFMSAATQLSAAGGSASLTGRTRALAALVLVAAGAGAGWMLGQRTESSGIGSDAIETSVLVPDTLVIEPYVPVSEGAVSIALSPDASQLVFVGRSAKGTQLFMRRLGDFTAHAVEGTEGAHSPFFTPQGDAVGFFTDRQVKRLTIADRRVTVVADTRGVGWGGAWLPDGRLVIAADGAGSLFLLSARGDSIRKLLCAGSCANPEVLPDGRHVLFASKDHLAVVDLESGTFRPLTGPNDAADSQGARGTLPRYDGDGHLVWVNTDGQLLAAAFDASNATITGAPVPVADSVRVETGRGAAQFALSRNGVIAFAPGPRMNRGILVRATRAGKLDTIPVRAENYTTLDLSHDGRRLLTSVVTESGETSFHLIDLATGRDSPWLTGKGALSRPRWAPDGVHVIYIRDGGVYTSDPGLSAPPQRMKVTLRPEFQVLPDGKRYVGVSGDTIVFTPFDGSGAPVRVIASVSGTATISADTRWMAMQEQVGSGSGIVVRAIDGTNRRFVVATGEEYSMALWERGTNELLFASQLPPSKGAVSDGGLVQEMWSVPYTASAALPFGQPHALFRVTIADFPGRNYTVGGSGSVFVFKQHVATPPIREVRLVFSWHKRLTLAKSAGARP